MEGGGRDEKGKEWGKCVKKMNGDRGWRHATVTRQGGQKNSDQISRVYITKAKPIWCDVP